MKRDDAVRVAARAILDSRAQKSVDLFDVGALSALIVVAGQLKEYRLARALQRIIDWIDGARARRA